MFDAELTPERYRRVLRRLFDIAERGDLKAITYILDRAMGKVAADPENQVSPWEQRARDEADRKLLLVWLNATLTPRQRETAVAKIVKEVAETARPFGVR